jgi:hypothetical protein
MSMEFGGNLDRYLESRAGAFEEDQHLDEWDLAIDNNPEDDRDWGSMPGGWDYEGDD